MTYTPPSQPDNSKTILDEQTALIGGIIATAIFGVPAALFAIGKFVSIIDDLVWVAIAIWATWMMIQFWFSEAYKGGLSVKEIVKAAIWPYDMYLTIRAGVRKQEGKPVSPDSDTTKKVLNEEQALWGGIIVSCITLIVLITSIVSAVAVVGGMIVIAIAGYVVGLFIQYWVSKAYTDGLTVNELLQAVAWPIATYKTIKAGVKARRQQS